MAGPLDRHVLDALLPDRPVRVQHRSGARWYLSSLAVEEPGLEGHAHPGLERDDAGRVTGVVHRADRWLRSLLPDAPPPALGPLGRRLAPLGVTGVTDMTPIWQARSCAVREASVVASLGEAVPEAPTLHVGARRGSHEVVFHVSRRPRPRSSVG